MPIAKKIRVDQAKISISAILNYRVLNDFARNEIGKILEDLGRKYGYGEPNKIVKEFNLDQKLDLKVYCPLCERVKK